MATHALSRLLLSSGRPVTARLPPGRDHRTEASRACLRAPAGDPSTVGLPYGAQRPGNSSMGTRHSIDTIVHGLMRGARATAFASLLCLLPYTTPSYSQPRSKDSVPAARLTAAHKSHPTYVTTPPRAQLTYQCEEELGAVRDYFSMSPNDPNCPSSPFSAVYDSASPSEHPLTGGKFIVTSADSPDLYVIGSEGENPKSWITPLQSNGRGITIGGKNIVGEDFIWVASENGHISRVSFDGNYLPPEHTEAVMMADIEWDNNSNTLLVYDWGENAQNHRILQYDVFGNRIGVGVPSPVSDGMGIAKDSCNGSLFISRWGTSEFLEITPSYDGNVLIGLENPQPRTWHDSTWPQVDDAAGLSYNPVTRQLVLVNGAGAYHPGIYTSIDDGCCEYAQSDLNRDGVVNFQDAKTIMDCLSGHQNPVVIGDCAICDFDADSDVDMRDCAKFQTEYAPDE